jgi:beta-galactosidase
VSVWAEQLKSLSADVEVLMKYGKSNGWLDDQPAVITRPYGKGRITYIGGILDDKLMASAAEWMVKDSGVTPVFGPVPDGVEVSRRMGGGKKVFILINYSQDTRQVTLPHAMKSLLEDKQVETVDLPVYGVAVLLDNK